jgi:hypothetical protein
MATPPENILWTLFTCSLSLFICFSSNIHITIHKNVCASNAQILPPQLFHACMHGATIISVSGERGEVPSTSFPRTRAQRRACRGTGPSCRCASCGTRASTCSSAPAALRQLRRSFLMSVRLEKSCSTCTPPPMLTWLSLAMRMKASWTAWSCFRGRTHRLVVIGNAASSPPRSETWGTQVSGLYLKVMGHSGIGIGGKLLGNR